MNNILDFLISKSLNQLRFEKIFYNQILNEEYNNIEELKNYYYYYFYCKIPLQQIKCLKNSKFIPYNHSFLKKLQKANKGEGYFDKNWTIKTIRNEEVIVYKKGIKLHVNQQKHIREKTNNISIGQQISIRFPKYRIIPSTGFYFAISNQGSPSFYNQIVRIYFHVKYINAPYLLKLITKFLSDKKIPFIYKTLSNPESYIRRDSSVLYFDKQSFKEIISVIFKINKMHPYLFAKGVPLFTKRLFSGIGLAEEPISHNRNESFGQHRCRIISQCIWYSYTKRTSNRSYIYKKIIKQLSKEQVDINKLYLNKGSEDIYIIKK